MRAADLVSKRGAGWVFIEPGYQRIDGMTGRVIETVPAQEFWYATEAEAVAHACWFLDLPHEWFPPPPA